MNILVVGRGWTGMKMYDELSNRGHRVILVSNKVALNENFNYFDWVVNCAGVTGTPNVDACENDKMNTIDGNAIFPIKLENLVKLTSKARFAHFSSGCIYTGTITDVNAEPNFFGSTYSFSKGVSDAYLKDRALVFRIRMPFTGENEPKNYLTKVLKYAKTAKLIDAGQNSLTDHDEAVRVACDLIEKGVPNGPYNLINEGSVNMHELVEMFGLDSVQWFTAEEFTAATAAGRSTCTIPSQGLMRPVQDALRDAIRKMKA